MRKTFKLLYGLVLIALLSQCKQPDVSVSLPQSNIPTHDNNLALGNPDGAQPSAISPTAYLIERGTYVLSYNQSRGIANWCSWH